MFSGIDLPKCAGSCLQSVARTRRLLETELYPAKRMYTLRGCLVNIAFCWGNIECIGIAVGMTGMVVNWISLFLG